VFTPKNLIVLLILYCPLTLGTWLPVNYIYVVLTIDFILLLILAKEIFRNRKILKRNYKVPVLLFCLSFYTSVLFGLPYKQMNDFTDYDSTASSVVFTWTQVIIMQLSLIYFIYIIIDNYDDILYFIKFILISGILLNIIGLVLYYVIGIKTTTLLGRIGLSFDDANYLGRFEVFIISISIVYLFFRKTNVIIKLFLSAFIVVSFLFLTLSVSRAALASLGIVIIVILLFLNSKSMKYTGIILTVLSSVFFLTVIGSQKVSPLGADSGLAGSFLDMSNATRVALIIASFSVFLDHPFFGIGIYNFFNAYVNHGYMPVDMPLGFKITVVHSWLFSTMAEQGLFGIIPLMYILYSVSVDLFRNTYRKYGDQKFIGIILISMFIILIFNGFVNPIFYAELQFSIIAGLIAGFLKVSAINTEITQYGE